MLPKGSPIIVICKTLRSDAFESEEQRRAAFVREKRCLKLFNYPQHLNIVPLLSSYSHGGDHCLLFTLLDMDLAAFFQKPAAHGDFQWDFTFFSALYGLARALNRAHHTKLPAELDSGQGSTLIGYHHDLRPANILDSKGTFLLADYGKGGVRPEGEDSRTMWKLGIGSYLAPECMDDSFKGQEIGRAIDVWAFACLMADVATFRACGSDGVTEFRTKRRESRDNKENWSTVSFHARGQVKEAVREWLGSLPSVGRLAPLNTALSDLIFSLLVPADIRPKIGYACERLGLLSLMAHFFAALDHLDELVDGMRQVNLMQGGLLMKAWFEEERLKAFGNVMCLFGANAEQEVPETVRRHGEACVQILLRIFHQLRQSYGATSARETTKIQQQNLPQHAGGRAEPITLETLDGSVRSLVDELWAVLPEAGMQAAERLWVHSMLANQDSTQWLDELEKTLYSEMRPMYQQGAAMAMMRKIRLGLADNMVNDGDLQSFEAKHTEVTGRRRFCGHQLAVYTAASASGAVPVLVETMRYDASWEKIPPLERALVMSEKARGLSVQPAPADLRLLKCFKFFEEAGDNKAGYSFVYEVPAASRPSVSAISPSPGDCTLTTHLEQLKTSTQLAKDNPGMAHVSQPLLGDKFRLASMLASNLHAFHGIGWYHENYHSNNVVFFNASSQGASDRSGGDPSSSLDKTAIKKTTVINASTSRILLQPYTVGLNKSRPGGEAWHTQGPSLDTEFSDYQHPDYRQVTKRYRNGYDYYTLGIVLLEIGLWTPLQAWARGSTAKTGPGTDDRRTLNPYQFRDLLLSRYVPRLAPRMGQSYHDVVKTLLDDVLDPCPAVECPEVGNEAEAFNKFLRLVVEPLSRIAFSCV